MDCPSDPGEMMVIVLGNKQYPVHYAHWHLETRMNCNDCNLIVRQIFQLLNQGVPSDTHPLHNFCNWSLTMVLLFRGSIRRICRRKYGNSLPKFVQTLFVQRLEI